MGTLLYQVDTFMRKAARPCNKSSISDGPDDARRAPLTDWAGGKSKERLRSYRNGTCVLTPITRSADTTKSCPGIAATIATATRFRIPTASQGRVQLAMQSMTQSIKTEEPVIKEIEVHEQKDEPVDCDSIDGDDTISVGDVDELCNVDLPIEHDSVDCELVELPVSIIDNNESLGLRIAELSTIGKPNIAQEAGIAAGDA